MNEPITMRKRLVVWVIMSGLFMLCSGGVAILALAVMDNVLLQLSAVVAAGKASIWRSFLIGAGLGLVYFLTVLQTGACRFVASYLLQEIAGGEEAKP